MFLLSIIVWTIILSDIVFHDLFYRNLDFFWLTCIDLHLSCDRSEVFDFTLSHRMEVALGNLCTLLSRNTLCLLSWSYRIVSFEEILLSSLVDQMCHLDVLHYTADTIRFHVWLPFGCVIFVQLPLTLEHVRTYVLFGISVSVLLSVENSSLHFCISPLMMLLVFKHALRG